MTSFSFYGFLQKEGKDEPFSIQFEADTENEACKMFDNLISNIDEWCQTKSTCNINIDTFSLNDEDMFGIDNDTYISKLNGTNLNVFDFLPNAVVKDTTGATYCLRDFIYNTNTVCVKRRKIQLRL